MKLLKVALFIGFVAFAGTAKAQYKKREWHTYAGPSVGTMYYVGELKKNSLPANGYMHASIGARISTQYKRVIALQASYTFGGLSGYDTLVSTVLQNRAYEFTTKTHDIEFLVKLTLLNHNKRITRSTKTVIYPKLVAGLGFLNFKPMREYKGQMIDLRALGTEGQYLNNASYPDPYGSWALGLKLGGELSITTGQRTTVDFYGYYTMAQTDYLDDVGGGAHIDVADLNQADNPQMLADLAYARILNGQPKGTPGQTRGNPDTNDGYFNFGIAISYRLTELGKGSYGNSIPWINRVRF